MLGAENFEFSSLHMKTGSNVTTVTNAVLILEDFANDLANGEHDFKKCISDQFHCGHFKMTMYCNMI